MVAADYHLFKSFRNNGSEKTEETENFLTSKAAPPISDKKTGLKNSNER
jgi:hypothetical protein